MEPLNRPYRNREEANGESMIPVERQPANSLRNRIAAVLSQHDAFGTDFVECLCGAEFDNEQVILNEFQPIWELHVADAVIAELGLDRQCHYDPGCKYHRYVTDWIADE